MRLGRTLPCVETSSRFRTAPSGPGGGEREPLIAVGGVHRGDQESVVALRGSEWIEAHPVDVRRSARTGIRGVEQIGRIHEGDGEAAADRGLRYDQQLSLARGEERDVERGILDGIQVFPDDAAGPVDDGEPRVPSRLVGDGGDDVGAAGVDHRAHGAVDEIGTPFDRAGRRDAREVRPARVPALVGGVRDEIAVAVGSDGDMGTIGTLPAHGVVGGDARGNEEVAIGDGQPGAIEHRSAHGRAAPAVLPDDEDVLAVGGEGDAGPLSGAAPSSTAGETGTGWADAASVKRRTATTLTLVIVCQILMERWRPAGCRGGVPRRHLGGRGE